MKHFFKTFLSVFLFSLVLTSCQKEAIPVQKEKISSNLTKQQEDFLFSEIARHLQDTTPVSTRERDLLNELHRMAQDVDVYYEGVDQEPNWEAKYNRIRKNMFDRVEEAVALASDFYDGNEGKIILAKNSYVLMSYHRLEKYMSEFMWTKLGLFAANEVRGGIVLSYTMRHVLQQTKIDLAVGNISGIDFSELLFEATRILMSGQISVFTDIGALGLLNHKYGPETFINESWLTQEARDGYAMQKKAQDALAAGKVSLYQDLQTEAAILFGAHEQLYTLDPLWSMDLMGLLAQINIWMHGASKGSFALFGDIFIGTNKYTELLFGHVIKLQMQNNDLRKGHDRVEIARYGFHTLNNLRKSTRWKPWVEYSEKRLGQQYGIYLVRFNP